MAPVFLDLAKKGSKKKKFTESEDEQIKALVGNNYDTVNWEMVAFALGNRTARQCKDRYHSYLAPGLNKNKWNEEEDAQLLDLVSKYGQKWKMLAPSFVGRPEVSLKNRFRLLQRRKEKKERLERQKNSVPVEKQPQQENDSISTTKNVDTNEQYSFQENSFFDENMFDNYQFFEDPFQFYF